MFLNDVKFETSAPSKEFWPNADLKELVILGRSNVGKSTFINRLTNNKNLAKTSSTPGRTRLLNFFKVNDEYRLVDAPGYGYQVGNRNSDLTFYKMMDEYLASRSNLVGALFLLDSRRVPNEDDKAMLEVLLHYSIPFIIIATKVDKLNQSERALLERKLLGELNLLPKTPIIKATTTKDNWQEQVIARINYLLSQRLKRVIFLRKSPFYY